MLQRQHDLMGQWFACTRARGILSLLPHILGPVHQWYTKKVSDQTNKFASPAPPLNMPCFPFTVLTLLLLMTVPAYLARHIALGNKWLSEDRAAARGPCLAPALRGGRIPSTSSRWQERRYAGCRRAAAQPPPRLCTRGGGRHAPLSLPAIDRVAAHVAQACRLLPLRCRCRRCCSGCLAHCARLPRTSRAHDG